MCSKANAGANNNGDAIMPVMVIIKMPMMISTHYNTTGDRHNNDDYSNSFISRSKNAQQYEH